MTDTDTQYKKSGIATLIGRSNVGKSTLLNALVGFKMAPVSPKAQTTRWALKGIYNDPRGQVMFVDTPGLFLKSPDKLTKAVNNEVEKNIKGIDLILYVVDPTREIGNEEQRLLAMVRGIEKKILVINKIDVPQPKHLFEYEHLSSEFAETIHLSAKTGKHLKSLLNAIFKYLPHGDPIHTETGTDLGTSTFKVWVGEIIREKIFHLVYKEVPYSVHVFVNTIEKKDAMLVIHANIATDNEKYRPMLIGKGGKKLKEIGTAARKELELILQKKIFLKLEVVTDVHWLEQITN